FERAFSPEAPPPAEVAVRMLVTSEDQGEVESFGVTRDGARITVSFREQATNLTVAEGVPEVARPGQGGR
ncbi:MAG TPA: hypothetical protein VFS60_18380, partial [Thermoanaerobaculia bacterium]|nr:hypothetical protein [Thermoanaerobaculia bacterium]